MHSGLLSRQGQEELHEVHPECQFPHHIPDLGKFDHQVYLIVKATAVSINTTSAFCEIADATVT